MSEVDEKKLIRKSTLGNSQGGVSRRDVLKYGGLVGAALGVGGAAGAGFASGSDTSSHTGWERYHYGDGMFFDREPFRRDNPTYEVAGEIRRIAYVEYLFGRLRLLGMASRPGRDGSPPKWTPDMGIEGLPEPLKDFYTKNPEKYKTHMETQKAAKIQHQNWEKFRDRYIVADAWSAANSATIATRSPFPSRPDKPPEEWDFRGIQDKPLEFISEAHAAEFIKKIAHSMGATLVGITKLKPEWVYAENLRGGKRGKFEVPKHWQYAIVTATPHEWDQMYANPTFGTSYDAYSRERIISGKLEAFIRHLGYPARAHCPPTDYDVIVPPIAIDAGLGEHGRNGILITPELGANARLACVTTNIPMKVDKPIDVGIARFCEKCKICADSCPSGSISKSNKPETVIRGFRRWNIDESTCFKMWNTVATSHPRGCRVCLGVCPYTRKNNWLHTIAREMDPRDPTGLVSDGLLAMQKGFFDYPKAEEYLPPPDGRNATYHEGPEWMLTEKWFKVKKTW